MSTTALGDSFRDTIAELLDAAGYRPIPEILFGNKRVDALFEREELGRRRLYALEAKNWKDPLDRGALETIYGGYSYLIQTNKIEELIVVSPQELRSAHAKAFVEETPRIVHMSFNRFQESLLGFREYLSTFVANHEGDGLETYFISPTMSDGGGLENYLDGWINGEDPNPIAIIASYGMGKTSLARHIAYKMAKRFLSGQLCRVPILVSLGAISREQSLEGLLGAVLTGINPAVRNYNFPLFFRLNNAGRFLILFDGFDEMKHMMTPSEFISNFDEINRVITGKAKVILLGRPNAFTSESERAYCLRGASSTSKIPHRRPDAPQYTEKTLQPFSPAQTRTFVSLYLTHHQEMGNITAECDFIAKRQSEIENNTPETLISRPVHARMLADIATDPNVEISRISRFALYDHFIDHLIRRELDKKGRGRTYKSDDWRSFACDLAWNLWTEPGTASIGGVRIDDIPSDIFVPYTPPGEDIIAVKRTLMSGSFLDEKNGGIYFYSHRSFQEFLVAEYIWNRLSDCSAIDREFATQVARSLSEQVVEFLVDRGDKQLFNVLLGTLGKSVEPLTFDMLKMVSAHEPISSTAYQRSMAAFSHIDAATIIVDSFVNGFTPDKMRRAVRIIADKAERKPMIILSSIYVIISAGSVLDHDVKSLIPYIVALLFYRGEKDLDFLISNRAKENRGEILRDTIFACVTSEFVERKLMMTLALDELAERIGQFINMFSFKFDNNFRSNHTLEFANFFSAIDRDYLKTLRSHYETDARVGIR